MVAAALAFGMAAILALRAGGFAIVSGAFGLVGAFVASIATGMPTPATWIDFILALLAYNLGLAVSLAIAAWRIREAA